MKRILTLFCAIFIALLLSCKSKEEKASDIMFSQIKKHIEDTAFKENVELKIYQLDFLGYDTINEHFKSVSKMLEYGSKIDMYNERIEELSENLDKTGKEMLRAARLGKDNPLLSMHEENLEDIVKLSKKMFDSLYYYRELDSIARVEVQSNTDPAEWYLAEVFFKATAIDNDVSENFMDTLRYMFDEKKNLVKQ